jgi:hypothetical protein
VAGKPKDLAGKRRGFGRCKGKKEEAEADPVRGWN